MDDDKLKIAKKCAKYIKKLPGWEVVWNDEFEEDEVGNLTLDGMVSYEEMAYDCTIHLKVIFKKSGKLKLFEWNTFDPEEAQEIDRDDNDDSVLKKSKD